jgi:hypothetical protein
MTNPGVNPGRRGEKPASNRLRLHKGLHTHLSPRRNIWGIKNIFLTDSSFKTKT